MKHLLDFRWLKFSEPSCVRYKQTYKDKLILDRIRVTEIRSQEAKAGQQLFIVIRVYIYIYVCVCVWCVCVRVEYVSTCGEGDRCICRCTLFGCHNMVRFTSRS